MENWAYKKIENEGGIPEDLRDGFANWSFPEISVNGGMTKYDWKVLGFDKDNPEKLKIGFGCDISSFCVIFAHHGVTIEPFVQIGPHSAILSCSTIDNKKGEVVLKRNCRIGAHSVVMPGVTVGENSIVGAYSLVNKDIPKDCIAFGIPAKVIRKIGGESR